MILAQRLLACAAPLPPAGVQIITSLAANVGASGTLFAIPDGVTDVAMALVPNGGNGAWTSFPTAFYAGGGAGWASRNSLAVSPGNSIRYRVVNWADGRHEIQIYINGVNGNATVLSARRGTSAQPGNSHGVGGAGVSGPTNGSGQAGSNNNRGGSAGKFGGATTNSADSTEGFGIVPGADSWAYTHQAGYGRGGIAKSDGSSQAGGGAVLMIVWGPGKGFSAGPGSYWPLS